MLLDDDKLGFCINSKKEVYAELQTNPHLELCACHLEAMRLRALGFDLRPKPFLKTALTYAMPLSTKVLSLMHSIKHARQPYLSSVLPSQYQWVAHQLRPRKRTRFKQRLCEAHSL